MHLQGVPKKWVLFIKNSINFEHLEHHPSNCQDKKNSMHYGQSLVIKSRLLCTVFDSHLREALKKKPKKFGNFPNFPDPPPYSLEISQILGVFLGQPKTPRN